MVAVVVASAVSGVVKVARSNRVVAAANGAAINRAAHKVAASGAAIRKVNKAAAHKAAANGAVISKAAADNKAEPIPIRDAPRPEFPLLLNTGRTVEHWHTRTKTGRIPLLEGLSPEAWVEIHPDDARDLGLRSGDLATVRSARGAVERIRVRATAIVRRGEVFIPFHWDERCANRLTDDEFDPISREPNYKQCAVRIEPSSR